MVAIGAHQCHIFDLSHLSVCDTGLVRTTNQYSSIETYGAGRSGWQHKCGGNIGGKLEAQVVQKYKQAVIAMSCPVNRNKIFPIKFCHPQLQHPMCTLLGTGS